MFLPNVLVVIVVTKEDLCTRRTRPTKHMQHGESVLLIQRLRLHSFKILTKIILLTTSNLWTTHQPKFVELLHLAVLTMLRNVNRTVTKSNHELKVTSEKNVVRLKNLRKYFIVSHRRTWKHLTVNTI